MVQGRTITQRCSSANVSDLPRVKVLITSATQTLQYSNNSLRKLATDTQSTAQRLIIKYKPHGEDNIPGDRLLLVIR